MANHVVVKELPRNDPISAVVVDKTGSGYIMSVNAVSEYFDVYGVEIAMNINYPPPIEISKTELNPHFKQIATKAAQNAFLTEQVRNLAEGLVAIVTDVYNPEGGLQRPKPSYLTMYGVPSAFFTAHFTTCPVEDLEETRRTSAGLRQQVLNRLDEIEEFDFYK